ncbi:MAG TPA: bile acid:sodium symporter [Pirellulaceae bacterium]|nr:bile acid:sodium symporter [Pirellulaceae bacterium]
MVKSVNGIRSVLQHWFLLALLLVLAIGLTWSESLRWLSDWPWLSRGAVAVTMFAMAWPIPIGQIWRAVVRPWPALWAVFISVGLFPLLAWGVAQGFSAELSAGLIVLGATPTTLASAAVWTRRAGGNDVVCLLVTVITNGLCFVITPVWVYLLMGNSLPPDQLWGTVVMLIWVVLVPIIVAQLLRASSAAATWSTRHKISLGVVAQIGILWVVWLGAIQAGQRLEAAGAALDWWSLSLLALALVGLHLCVWWGAFRSSRWLGFSRSDQIAVGFSASQKTLMVGLAVALQLDFNVVPLVLYHILQLIIDTLIVGGLRRPSA